MWRHVSIYNFISHENMTHIALYLVCKFPQDLALGHCVAFLAVMNHTVHHELWWLLVHRCLSWKSNNFALKPRSYHWVISNFTQFS